MSTLCPWFWRKAGRRSRSVLVGVSRSLCPRRQQDTHRDPRRRSPDGIADRTRLCHIRPSGLVHPVAAGAANNTSFAGADCMTTKRLGLIMNGVTGRMGLNQHLIRSIVAIRDQGGVLLSNGDRMMPDPILVGRDAEKVEALAKRFDVQRCTTELDKALTDKNHTTYLQT